ncbi:MAG TPA: hypothetical protein VHR84_19300 [Terriglobales bacterium]|jgi:hypothetical protein|nr:hypothetical protein [Terriglobales bacterium]
MSRFQQLRAVSDHDRFNTNHPDICPSLRWKGQFILADDDPTVPHSNEGLFWCLHTQNCIGPDGEVAEPGSCCSSNRDCHKSHSG